MTLLTKDELKKWSSLAALVALQISVGVVYKLSLGGSSSYRYSTFSALAIAEAIKFTISACFNKHSRIPKRTNVGVLPTAVATADRNLQSMAAVAFQSSHLYAKIFALAAMYCVNNQLTFSIFLTADPATVNIFKSASTLVTAAIACVVLGRYITWQQWAAIVLQVSGLFVTQFDACRERMLLPTSTYILLLTSVTITAVSGVLNEYQLKTLPLTLHQQNMVLYAGGFVLNTVGHFWNRSVSSNVPGFFSGYSAASIAVVVVNACFGIVVTAVYKYADSIMKCLASAVTTVALLGVSWASFGLQLNATMLAGCITVIIAVSLYATSPTVSRATASANYRALVAVGVAMTYAGCKFAIT